MDDANLVIKKYIPSLVLFIVGFFVFFKYMEQSITMGIIGGWFFGGTVWGWYLTRKWFRFGIFEATGDDDHYTAFDAARLLFKVVASVTVGVFAMPVGIIQLIIALFVKGKEVSDAVNPNKVEDTNQSQSTVNDNQNNTHTLDKPSIGFAILGFFVPLVGLILYLVWKRDMPYKAKSCGKGALIGFILFYVIPTLFITVYPMIMEKYNW